MHRIRMKSELQYCVSAPSVRQLDARAEAKAYHAVNSVDATRIQ